MSSRADLAVRVARAVGPGVLEVTDPGNGWPALGRLLIRDQIVNVALFVGPVGPGGRNRDEFERRFQNPGTDRPITHVPGHRSLLLGLWWNDHEYTVDRPVLVLADAGRRIGVRTRYSVFASVATLSQALDTGWASASTMTSEVVRCFDARLLPVAVEAAAVAGAEDEDLRIRDVIEGAGLVQYNDPPAADRARRAAWAVIRDRRFSMLVRTAYGGLCAMCGLGNNLCHGAHIYPVSAPGSLDIAWNGLALCPNHHAAFDRYLIFVHPITRRIAFHPSISRSIDSRALIDTSYPRLREPIDRAARPRSAMFTARYAYYEGMYGWI